MAEFTVKHYGPGTAPDFDHSTSVVLVRRGSTDILGLETHEELDDLILALMKAREECSDHWAFPEVVKTWPIVGDE